jgi:class 3 adenylate cyclase
MATIASTYNPQVLSSREKLWSNEEGGHSSREHTLATKPAHRAQASRLHFPSINSRAVLFYSLNTLHQGLSWSLLAVAGVFLVLFGLQFPHAEQWDRARLIGIFHQMGDPLVVMALIWIRSMWADFSFAGYLPLGFGLGGLVVRSGMKRAFAPVLRTLRPKRRSAKAATPAPIVFFSDSEIESGATVDSERARRDLVERYKEIETALLSAKRRQCTFLSIDVAGSTRMKENERELPVTVTFQAYMNMLEEVFAQHSAWKMSWTPDGVMVCFLDANLAVAAAQAVLRRLRTFNRTENLLRSRISVRCGLHEGEVPIYEDSKLEKIAHQVLDVTGHMQKHANPDTLWLSGEVVERLEDKAGFQPADRQVDGHQVYEWSPCLISPDRAPVVLPPPAKAGNTDPTWA